MITWPRCVALSMFLSSWLIGGQLVNAQTIDDEFRANIETLIEVSGTQRLSVQVVNFLGRQTLESLKKSQPNLPDQTVKFAAQVISEEFAKRLLTPELTAQLVPLYAKQFTPAEVRGLLDFYRSELGRKYVTAMPAVVQESVTVTQAYAKKLMPQVLEAVKQRLAQSK